MRPVIHIDWSMADALLAAGAPGSEVADFFGMHQETFYRRVQEEKGMGFTEYKTQKKSTGEAVLRLHQYNKAVGLTKKGDNTLLIWLGKQRLNQRESPIEHEISPETNARYHAVLDQLNALQQNGVASQSTQLTKPEEKVLESTPQV